MINLYYIRAAIEAATGITLPLPRVRELLVEEGIITQRQADEEAREFIDYNEFYAYDAADTSTDDKDFLEGLPD
jgi:hypothetical protein